MVFKPTFKVAQYLLYSLAVALVVCIAGAGCLYLYNAYTQQASDLRRGMNDAAYQAQIFFDQREMYLRAAAASVYRMPSGEQCTGGLAYSAPIQDASGQAWCLSMSDAEQDILNIYHAQLVLVYPQEARASYFGEQRHLDLVTQGFLLNQAKLAAASLRQQKLAPVYWRYAVGVQPRLFMLTPVWADQPEQAWLALEVNGVAGFLPAPDESLQHPNHLLLTSDLQVIERNGVLRSDLQLNVSELLASQKRDRYQLTWDKHWPRYLYLQKTLGEDGWSMVFYVRIKDIVHNQLLPLFVTLLSVLVGWLMVLAVVWQIRKRLLLPAAQQVQALHETEQLTRTIIDMAPIGLCLLEEDGQVLFGNHLARAWLQEEDQAYVQTLLQRGAASVLRQRQAGTSVQVTLRTAPYRDRQIVVCSVIDVSGFTAIERSLTAAKQDADEANRAKSEFLATMSHEIRTPLFGIMGTMELLGLTNLDQRQSQYLATARQSSDMLLRTINEVLTVSRLDAGKAPVESLEFCPVSLMHSVLSTYTDSARLKNILLYAVAETNIPLTVYGDELRIRQILNNLISNSLKFTVAGQIVLRLSCAPSVDEDTVPLRFQVADTGVGMSPSTQEKIFMAWQTTEHSRLPNSSGLGLFICKSLSELMGGSLTVTSGVGLGTSVNLALDVRADLSKRCPPLAPQRVFVCGAIKELVLNTCSWLQSWGLQATPFEPGDERFAQMAILLHTWPAAAQIPDWNGKVIQLEPPGYVTQSRDRGQQSCVHAFDLQQLYEAFKSVPAKEEPASTPQTLDTLPKQYRVLVVDDNAINREVLAEQLQHLGCEVVLAQDALQALSRLQELSFDVLLTDINMPFINGIDLVRQMRQQGCTIPVYGVTAAAANYTVEQALDAGMLDVLPRPLSMSVLSDVLRRL